MTSDGRITIEQAELDNYIFGKRAYRVAAPLVAVPLYGGKDVYLRKGALLPRNSRLDWIDRQLQAGLIEAVTK